MAKNNLTPFVSHTFSHETNLTQMFYVKIFFSGHISRTWELGQSFVIIILFVRNILLI